MKKEKILQEIEKLLDEWDPIGVLQDIKPITYTEGLIGEYSKYVKYILEIYLLNRSIYNYLIELQGNLSGEPDKNMIEEIKTVASKIIGFLSQCKIEDVKKCL